MYLGQVVSVEVSLIQGCPDREVPLYIQGLPSCVSILLLL